MNICYLAGSTIPSRTANSVHVMKMCQAYARQGHQVTLIVPDHREGIEADVIDVFEYYGVSPDFKIIKLGKLRPLKLWYMIVMPLRAIFATKADLYHTRMVWSGWGLTTLFRQPTMIEMHDVPPAGSLRERCLRATTGRKRLKSVILITNSLAKALAHAIQPSAKIVIAPDGVDEQLVDSSQSQQQAKSDLELPVDSSLLVVYTGHLYPGRGIEIVVEMARRHGDMRFLVIGGRELDIQHWRSMTTGMENLTFAGFVAPRNVFRYLIAADILLMPYAHQVSHSGGGDTAAICSPMKMFEYLASGRPIVSSDLPVLQEVLQAESNCLIASYGDFDHWSQQLTRLKMDAELRRQIGQQARKDAARYTWESRARKIIELSGVGDS